MSVKNISPEQLKALLTQQPAPFLLDVREAFELQAFGAVPGVINIPMGQLVARMQELPGDRALPVVHAEFSVDHSHVPPDRFTAKVKRF